MKSEPRGPWSRVMEAKEKGRRKKPWGAKIEVKGGGGILILGGVLIAAAIGAGTALSRRRRSRPASDASSEEKRAVDCHGRLDEGGDETRSELDRQGECPMDSTVDVQKNNSISKTPASENPDVVQTENSILQAETDDDGFVGVEELPIGIQLDMNHPTWQILEKSDFVAHNEIDETETPSTESQMGAAESMEFVFVEKEAQSTESQMDMAQRLTEQILLKSEFALADEIGGEKEISSAACQLDISQQQTEQVLDESMFTLVHAEKEETDAISNESEDGMNHHQTEQIFEESELAYDDEEMEDEAPLKKTQLGMTVLGEVRSACVQEINEVTQSNDSRFGTKECQSIHICQKAVFAPAEGIEKEEASPTEPQCEMTAHKSELILKTSEFFMKEIEEQEEEESSIESSESEQVLDDPKLALVHEVQEEKEISSTESEYGMNHHQVEQIFEESELVCDNEEEGGDAQFYQTQLSMTESQFSMKECQSNHVRDQLEFAPPEEIEKEEDSPSEPQIKMTQYQSDLISKGSELSTMKEINKMEEEKEASSTESQEGIDSSSDEEAAEMREEGSDSAGVSPAESNAEAIWPAEATQQEKSLWAVELEDTNDKLEISGEIDDIIHVKEAAEGRKESILRKEATTENMTATKLMPNREKALDAICMNNTKRLFLLLLVMALTLGLLSIMSSDSLHSNHFMKISYQLYQILFPSTENTREV